MQGKGSKPNPPHQQSEEFLEAGKKRLAGDEE
jgi:hypothetical protein